jgi:hypothetical protein
MCSGVVGAAAKPSFVPRAAPGKRWMENVQAAFFISAAASALVCAAVFFTFRNLRGILQLLKRQISPH